jgi:hypothetical protein
MVNSVSIDLVFVLWKILFCSHRLDCRLIGNFVSIDLVVILWKISFCSHRLDCRLIGSFLFELTKFYGMLPKSDRDTSPFVVTLVD